MHLKPRSKGYFISGLLFAAIAVVALNTVLAVGALNRLDESQRWVEHTYQVMNQVERIMGSAKDAETGARGFLITSDAAYLGPYTSGTKELPGELDAFGELTKDNPRQIRMLSEMRAVIEERLTLLKQGIDLRQSGDTRQPALSGGERDRQGADGSPSRSGRPHGSGGATTVESADSPGTK